MRMSEVSGDSGKEGQGGEKANITSKIQSSRLLCDL